jgi:hypothetical protein
MVVAASGELEDIFLANWVGSVVVATCPNVSFDANPKNSKNYIQ